MNGGIYRALMAHQQLFVRGFAGLAVRGKLSTAYEVVFLSSKRAQPPVWQACQTVLSE
jgi:hypothetical protein